jgi:hypothetical protein
MRKVLPILFLLIVPSALFAQSAVRVTSVLGRVEWRAASSRNFVPLTAASQQLVQTGDELRTGPDAQVVLELADQSYMVVSENSKLTIDDHWNSNARSLINLMVGKVRFFIQKLGGRPNPYRVTTPTALIAVRGTIFEVSVDAGEYAEVRCFEGRVAVETVGLPDREVILDAGRKTLVRPGEYPLAPVNNDEALQRNRVLRLAKKNVPEADTPNAPSLDALMRDNDRRNRAAEPLRSPNSRTNDNPERAKPTLNFPR